MNEERTRMLHTFLEEDPSDSFSRFALALEYLKIQDIDTARSHFEFIEKNDPGYIGVYYHLGKLYQSTEQIDKARDTFTKGIAMAHRIQDAHSAKELKEALEQLNSEDA